MYFVPTSSFLMAARRVRLSSQVRGTRLRNALLHYTHTPTLLSSRRLYASLEKVASSDTTYVRWRTLADDVERRKKDPSIENVGISVYLRKLWERSQTSLPLLFYKG